MQPSTRWLVVTAVIDKDKWDSPLDELTLAAVPSAVNLTRLLVQSDLARWRFDAAFIGRVGVVADDLVAHAVATTGVTADAPLYAAAFDALDVITVRLRAFAGRVAVEVWDHSEAPPHERLATSRAVAESEYWDFAVPRPGLRVVWCVVVPARPVGGPVERLPMRVPGPTHTRDSGLSAESPEFAVMRRVVDGLHRMP